MSIARGHDDRDIDLAMRQFAAEPYLSQQQARLEYAGTRGNMGPGFGKTMRKLIARGERKGATGGEKAAMMNARKALATRGGP